MESINYNALNVAQCNYDAGMREITHTLGNGLSTQIEYGRNDNLKTRMAVAGRPELSYNYAYDPNKNITDENIEGVIADYSWSSVGYDDDDRLTSWNRDNSESRIWNLDPLGNFLSRVVDGTQELRDHNLVNEVTSIDNVSIHYDDKGNLIQDNNGQTYVWDIDNHMKSSTASGVVTQYEYDALGRRLSKSRSGSETVYVSSGAQVVSEYNDAGTHERSYVYGSYVDKPVVMIDGATGAKSYYHCNYQYSVSALTDESGAVIELYAYTPYGARTVFDAEGAVKADSDNPYGFTGRRLDEETGLWYFRARMYHEGLGRFISRDPLGYVDGMNLYRGYFVPNGMDPSGKGWLEAIVQGTIQATVAVATAAVISAVVVGATITAPVAIAVGAVALTTGIIAGAMTDDLGDAALNGLTNGLVQGAVGGAGVAITSLSATATITTTQAVIGNTVVNVAAANVSVAISGHAGEWEYHLAATASAVVFGVGGGMASEAGDDLLTVMFGLNGEVVGTAFCKAVEFLE